MRKGSILPMNVNPGYLPKMFVESLSLSYKALPHLLPVQMGTSALINNARTNNGLAFLESEAEWALLIDSDMVWFPEAIIRLLKTAKEQKAKVVSGLTFMQQKARIVPHAYAMIPNQKGGDGKPILAPYALLPSFEEPFKVEATGGACLLVHRDVYADVKKMTEKTTAYYWQEETYSPRNKKQKGEDLVFCERIKAVGYDIWYEPRSLWLHTKKPETIGVKEYIAFLESLKIEHGQLLPTDA